MKIYSSRLHTLPALICSLAIATQHGQTTDRARPDSMGRQANRQSHDEAGESLPNRGAASGHLGYRERSGTSEPRDEASTIDGQARDDSISSCLLLQGKRASRRPALSAFRAADT